jgi:hypothetical protein
MLSTHYVFAGIFMAAVVFAFLASRSTNTILALLVLMIALFAYIVKKPDEKTESAATEERLALDITGRRETGSANYYVPKFAKLRFLPENAELVEVARDLRFVRIFDKPRYADLLLMLDRFQKVYMYILGERYPCRSYVPTLMDLRDSVAEILYGLVFAVPEAFRHTYGFEPGPVIEGNTERFMRVSQRMVETVKGFCAEKEPYFPMYAPRPYEKSREDRLP